MPRTWTPMDTVHGASTPPGQFFELPSQQQELLSSSSPPCTSFASPQSWHSSHGLSKPPVQLGELHEQQQGLLTSSSPPCTSLASPQSWDPSDGLSTQPLSGPSRPFWDMYAPPAPSLASTTSLPIPSTSPSSSPLFTTMSLPSTYFQKIEEWLTWRRIVTLAKLMIVVLMLHGTCLAMARQQQQALTWWWFGDLYSSYRAAGSELLGKGSAGFHVS